MVACCTAHPAPIATVDLAAVIDDVATVTVGVERSSRVTKRVGCTGELLN
jgi:hypothetical protein